MFTNSALIGLGVATLNYGQPISVAAARRMACEAKVIPVVLGGESEPLDVGRAIRTVPMGIRRALVARDRGMRLPRLRPATRAVRSPPLPTLDRRRRHRGAQLLPAVPRPPSTSPPRGWDITIHGGRVEFRPPAIINLDRRALTNPLRR